MLHRDAMRQMLLGQQAARELLEHLRQSPVEIQVCAERLQLAVLRPIHPEGVEQHLHVCEFAIITAFAHELAAPAPEAFVVNAERGEHHLVLHVARA